MNTLTSTMREALIARIGTAIELELELLVVNGMSIEQARDTVSGAAIVAMARTMAKAEDEAREDAAKPTDEDEVLYNS